MFPKFFKVQQKQKMKLGLASFNPKVSMIAPAAMVQHCNPRLNSASLALLLIWLCLFLPPLVSSS